MTTAIQTKTTSLISMLKSDEVIQRFQSVLGTPEAAGAFMSSILSVYNGSQQLKSCTPVSIITAGLHAASMNLSVEPALGLAAIVPYGDIAQFQLMYKGLRELAIRTEQYDRINVAPYYQGEHVVTDRITGDIKLEGEPDMHDGSKIAGYIGYLRLKTGFERFVHWPLDRIETHAREFSKKYQKDIRENTTKSMWSKDRTTATRQAMEKKTVLIDLLRGGQITKGTVPSTPAPAYSSLTEAIAVDVEPDFPFEDTDYSDVVSPPTEGERPWTAEQVRGWVGWQAGNHYEAGRIANDKQRGLLRSMLASLFGDDTHRHAACVYLADNASTTEIEPHYVLALLDWMKITRDKETKDYIPGQYVPQEAQAVKQFVQENQGQLPLDMEKNDE